MSIYIPKADTTDLSAYATKTLVTSQLLSKATLSQAATFDGITTTTGSISSPAWGDNGVIISTPATTLTDTTSSGIVTSTSATAILGPTIAASHATTYNIANTLRLSSPTAGTNVTFSSLSPNTGKFALNVQGDTMLNGNLALYQDTTHGTVIYSSGGQTTIDSLAGGLPMGLTIKNALSVNASTTLNGNMTQSGFRTTMQGSNTLYSFGGYIQSDSTTGSSMTMQGGTVGSLIRTASTTYTVSTAANGTDASECIVAFNKPTIAATNTNVTINTVANGFFDQPVAGTNATITNAYALWSGGGLRVDKQLVMNMSSVGSTSYTTLTTDFCLLCSSTAVTTITLTPPAPGTILKVKDVSGTTRHITITPTTGNVDNAASYVMNTAYAHVELIYDGANWWSI